MTPSQLKAAVKAAHPNSMFFCRQNMRFAGDTLRNYGVRSYQDCWELYRRQPVKHGCQTSVYFRKKDYVRIHVGSRETVMAHAAEIHD